MKIINLNLLSIVCLTMIILNHCKLQSIFETIHQDKDKESQIGRQFFINYRYF